MEELNMEAFHPKKAELVLVADGYTNLQISGVEDKEGYALVDNARKDLKQKRIEITKTGKQLRENALAYQRQVIAVEKELVSIIEPVEDILEKKQKDIDDEIVKAKRLALLPERKELLNQIHTSYDDDHILLMNDDQFARFLNDKKSEFLAAKEAALKKEQQELEQRKMIEDKIKQDRIEQAEQEARRAQEAIRKAEEEKQRAIQQEREKHEAEIRKMKEAEEEKQRLMQKAIEEKNVQDFLASHHYEAGSTQFHLKVDANLYRLYKLIGELNV